MDKSTYLINESDLTFGKHLGHGYFGVVYCAHWRQPDGNHIKCAIKVLNQNQLDVTQEIMNMENLRHENIVQLYGLSFDYKRRVCIVLEYCEGGSLLKRLRDQEKPNILVTKLLDYSEQIVKGMQYLENNGCIHRDLAARNVLLTQNEEVVKIGDFGLSRFVPHQVNSQQMEYQESLDTPFPFAWCPPEVLLSRKYSNASDVWAFGVTLWELFSCGEDPYAGMNRQEVLEYIEKERLRKPKNCSKEIYKIIRSCWEYDAAKRSNWLILGDALQDCKFPIVTAIKPSTVYRYGSGYEYIFINDVDATHFYGQCKMKGVFGNIEKSLVKIDPNDSIFSQSYKSARENDRSFDSNFSSSWSAPTLALPPYKKYEVPSSPVPPSRAPPSLKPTSCVTPLSQPNDTWTNLGPEPLKRIEIEPRTTSNKLCGCLPPFEGNKKCYIIAICVICAILVAAIIATIIMLITKDHNNNSSNGDDGYPDPGCSSGWSAYHDKCYKLYNSATTFNEAEATCEQEGGNLVSIHSADLASSYKNDASWIGMTWIAHGSCSNGYSCDNSSYTISCPTWIDGTSVDYFNLIGSCMGTQQYGCCVAFFCTVICPRNSPACTSSEYGMWGVTDCMAASTQSVIPTSFIYESKRTTQPSPTLPTTTNSLYNYCDNGWILNQENGQCYTRVEGKKTFADASSYCRGEGGQLASIHSADENEFILDLPSNNQDIGSWIGLEWISNGQCVPSSDSCNKVGEEPSCPYWSDGTSVQYFNLAGTCTDYNQGCCVYFFCTFMCNRVTSDACTAEEFGTWFTADCTSTSNDSAIPTSFICEKLNYIIESTPSTVGSTSTALSTTKLTTTTTKKKITSTSK